MKISDRIRDSITYNSKVKEIKTEAGSWIKIINILQIYWKVLNKEEEKKSFKLITNYSSIRLEN